MIQVADLAKYILNLEPQKNAESLAFYHFLKNACDLNAPLTPDTIDFFIRRSLAFPLWQENREALWKSTRDLLDSFHRDIGLPFPPQAIRAIDDYECIQIRNPKHLAQIVERHIADLLKPNERFRAIWDGKDNLIGLRLRPQGELTVHIFDRWTLVREGQLSPLRWDQMLHYTTKLDLQWDVMQSFDTSPFCTARFQVVRGRAVGCFTKSYTFQKTDPFEVPPEQFPQLFYPLKRIESLFLNRETDPFYREILTLLEHATHLVEQGDSESIQLGQRAFEKAQIALEHIYREDRMLSVLLKELGRQLQAAQTQYSHDKDRPLTL